MDFKSLWSKKEPINGINCFFTEDSFNKYSRLPSTLEERLLMKIKQLKGEPVCPSSVQVQSHAPSSRNETSVLEENVQNLSDNTTEPTTVQIQTEAKTQNTPTQQRTKRKLGGEPPYVKKVAPPRKSRFSHDQQKRYVYLYKKYAHRAPMDATEEERSEIRELQILTSEVLEEQKEFQEFQEVLANTSHKTDYTYTHPATRTYMEDYIQSRKKEVELYPKYYNTETSFKIDGEGQSSKMVYIKPLLQLGIVPKMILPTVTQQLKPELPLDSPAINQQYPVSKNRNHKPGAWNHEPCSMDDNAAHLAVGNRAHIVISSGALQCLVDNHAPKHLEDWEMPVTVRDYPIKEGDKVIVHRVVFIDRPFLKPQLTSKDKNTKFFKHALKAFIAKPSQKGHVFSKIENSQGDTKPVGPTPADNTKSSTISTGKASMESVCRTVTKEEPFSTEDASLEDLECFGTAKKAQNCLSKNKHTSASEVEMESQLCIEDLESFGTTSASKCRKTANRTKSKDSDQDLLKKIKEMHKPQKQTPPIKNLPKEKLTVETKEVEMNSTGKSSACEVQGNYTDTNSHGEFDSAADLKGQVGCVTDTADVPNEEHFQPDVLENTSMDTLNEISQTSTHNITNDVPNKSKTPMIPWRTPELLNESKEKTTSGKSVKIPTSSALQKSEEDSSDEDEDKLYIMESPTKKMEVITEAPASPSPASPDPGAEEMEICKIIPIGSDYASDSAQSPERLQESPTSPCKESFANSWDALPCPIIPLYRESEDETVGTSDQGQTSQHNIQLPVANFEKPVSTPLRRSNRRKNNSQSTDSDSAQCEKRTCTLDNSFRDTLDSCGVEGDSDEEVKMKRKKKKQDVIISDSEEEEKKVKAETGKKKRGRPRKNPIVVSVEPKENESTEEKPGTSGRMVTRSRSSVGGTSEEEASDKEGTHRSRKKHKPGISVSEENKVETGKSAKDGNEIVKDQEIASSNNQSLKISSVSSEVPFVQAKRQRSDSAENLLGKIGPQKRVSRVGIQPTRPAMSISKPESSKCTQPEAKSREKSSRQTHKLQDKFSLDSILNVQQKLHKSSGEQNLPNYTSENVDHKIKLPQRNNVTYNLWDLGGFSVIVRCNVHGVIRDINQQLSFIHLVPKLEYQCLFGMEQVTPSETARTWISSYIRPNCRVVRARFHTQRTELVCLEELQPAQIVPPTQGFSPGNAFLMLQNIFHHLHQLSPGQYLLSHKKTSDKCLIKKATEDNKRGSYDLHFNQLGFADPEFDQKKVPWTPLNPAIMLPYHTLHGRIPLTFDPSDFKFNYSSQSKIAKRKKNKGKRNKGKNKTPQKK